MNGSHCRSNERSVRRAFEIGQEAEGSLERNRGRGGVSERYCVWAAELMSLTAIFF